MADDFVNWEDLDLDYHLGEGNWTDSEQNDVLGPEEEWLSSENGGENESIEPTSATIGASENKENIKKSTSRKQFQCPLCEKCYSSPSGFRGHVLKKHERPDIKAHKHQIQSKNTTEVELPQKEVPLTTRSDFEKDLPEITKSALHAIQQDQFLCSPHSISGLSIVKIASAFQLQLAVLCSFLLTHLNSTYAGNFDTSELLQNIYRLRLNMLFVNGMSELIRDMPVEVPSRHLKTFTQHFLTKFTTSFFSRQAKRLECQRKFDAEAISDNDKQVIFYICGYIIHTLKKRYYKIKNCSKREKLISLLDNLLAKGGEHVQFSDWMTLMNRGGLKQPSEKFYKLMLQIERWLRESVHKDKLHQDSLVLLRIKLLDYQLLKTCWDRLIPDSDNTCKWLLLDHVLALFLKVRGFAMVKLVRKELLKKRKHLKANAGSRKALRHELKEMNKKH